MEFVRNKYEIFLKIMEKQKLKVLYLVLLMSRLISHAFLFFHPCIFSLTQTTFFQAIFFLKTAIFSNDPTMSLPD